MPTTTTTKYIKLEKDGNIHTHRSVIVTITQARIPNFCYTGIFEKKRAHISVSLYIRKNDGFFRMNKASDNVRKERNVREVFHGEPV